MSALGMPASLLPHPPQPAQGLCLKLSCCKTSIEIAHGSAASKKPIDDASSMAYEAAHSTYDRITD